MVKQNYNFRHDIPGLQNGWNVQTLGGAWAVLLNLLNFTDFSLHAAYTALLCVPLFQGSVTTLENQFLAAGIPVGEFAEP